MNHRQQTLEELALHDAVISSIHLSWEADRCDLVVWPVGRGSHVLSFEGFTNIQLPKREPWGRSASINSARQAQAGLYEIELQSGDVLSIEAPYWSWREEPK